MQPRLVMIRFPLQEFRSGEKWKPLNPTNPIDPGMTMINLHLLKNNKQPKVISVLAS